MANSHRILLVGIAPDMPNLAVCQDTRPRPFLTVLGKRGLKFTGDFGMQITLELRLGRLSTLSRLGLVRVVAANPSALVSMIVRRRGRYISAGPDPVG